MWGALLISSLYKIFAVEKTFLQHTQWICEGDPHSPPEGEASQGGKSPLTPLSDFFLMPDKGNTPRGEGRRDPERPWLHRNRIQGGGLDFYRATIFIIWV